MSYRAEIDGLRAVAVTAVILFHADVKIFSGGYLGVDIFFVISGYLITLIVIEDLENNNFSLLKFYERRARRILPALLVMLGLAYVFSSIAYLPGAHKEVGQNVVASVLSASNILLYLKGRDYFGLEIGSNPIHHTWSLGVEEQFYLVFPIILLFVWRFGWSKRLGVIGALAIASAVLSESVGRVDAMYNFYLLPTRAWELFIGSCSAIIAIKRGVRPNPTVASLALLAILIPIFVFDDKIRSPSLFTLVPVLGAAIFILYEDGSTIIGRFLSTRIMVSIGLISYSLYLYHLPLQIYFDYALAPSVFTSFYYLGLLLVCAYLSYRYIETPFRRALSRKHTFSFISVFSIILVGLGGLGHYNGGYPERSDLFLKLQHNNGWGLNCNGNFSVTRQCSNSINPEIAILGNSYAMTWVRPIEESSQRGIVQLTQDSCAVGFIDYVTDAYAIPCPDFFKKAMDTIINQDSIKTIIISSNFNKELNDLEYLNSFNDLLENLLDKKIILIGPTPRAPFNVGACLLKKKLFSSKNGCDFLISEGHIAKVNALKELARQYANTEFIDITDFICNDGLCAMESEEGVLMYVDSGHLSLGGARSVFSNIEWEL